MEFKKISENKKLMTILVIVVLLIIAMVSYTYSFFTVTATDSDSIVGAAASLGVDLTVTKIAPSNDDGLIPQLDDYITKAVIGRKGNCIDDNGNNVCQVYQITVKNTSAASVTLDGTLELNARDNPNLKWAEISGITEPTLKSEINTPSVTKLVKRDFYEANATKNYYIVLWISETDLAQFDTGDFTGVVTFKDSSPSKTISGTWKFNDEVTMFSTDAISEEVDFTFRTEIPGEGTYLFTCNYISSLVSNENVEMRTAVIGIAPDIGETLPLNILLYQQGVWDPEDMSNDEGYKIITFTEEQEVSTEFYEWFTANAVKQDVKSLSGTWRFNDVIVDIPSEDVTIPVIFTVYPDFVTGDDGSFALGDGFITFNYMWMGSNLSYTGYLLAYGLGSNSIPGTVYSTVDDTGWNGFENFVSALYPDIQGTDVLRGWGQTITFPVEQPVSDEFYEWFTANATKQS